MPAAASTRSNEALPRYNDSAFEALETELDALEAKGVTSAALAKAIEGIYVERNRAIRNGDFRALDPQAVADAYLLPRKDLHRFVLVNWIKRIFLPSLKNAVRQKILMFGLGRLFSAYNDLGAQHCTDADLNVIAADELGAKDFADLGKRLGALRDQVLERFGIVLELHPDFTLLRQAAVLDGLRHADERRRLVNLLFYKSNERSILIFEDNEAIRESVFSKVRHLPDAYLFEHFLGLAGPKTTYAKLRTDAAALSIGLDGTCDMAQVRTVIGSRAWGLYCRRLFPLGLFVSPPEWHFSMKYFVNRAYDYVCALRNSGYSLEDIGFDAPAGKDRVDPDYRYLRTAHKLMLHLQELIQTKLGVFGTDIDCSYMSRARFLKLVELDGERFRADFDAMLLSGGLLKPSDATRYRELAAKIKARATHRVMEGRISDLAAFPKGFRYETIGKDSARYKARVPYSWADLGYFAFQAIGARIAAIVEGRLMPALPRLGMPSEDFARYAREFGGK